MSENVEVTKENFDAEKFGNSVLSWGALAKFAQSKEEDHIVYFKLPGTIHQCNRDYDTMFLVKMPDGSIASGLIGIEENGKPSFSIPGDVMRQFVKQDENVDNIVR